MSEATPRPWVLDKRGRMTGSNNELVVVSNFCIEFEPLAEETIANNELICRAVNLHDAMIATIQKAYQQLCAGSVNDPADTLASFMEANGIPFGESS